MPLAVNQGTFLDYEVLGGSGPPLLMIRGLSRDRRFWIGLDRLLARSFTVVVFDNRGVGRSSKPEGRWTVAQMADDAAAVIEAAGFEKVHVFGMSLGGMIAQELVLRHPGRVDRLVLGCTGPGTPEGSRPPPWVTACMAVALVLPNALSNRIVTRITLSPESRAAHPETGDRWLALLREHDVSRWSVVKQMDAALEHRTAPRLRRITSPTLILSGDADRLIMPSNSEYLADHIPGARIEYLSGAGHDFPAEQPEQTAQAIVRFCA